MSIFKTLYNRIIRHSWDICFVSYNDIKAQWTYIPIKHNYKDRLFADPFILDETDSQIILLVEEFRYKENRGRIARINVNKKTFQLEELSVILDLETHLSFPAILRIDDNVFIYPENAAGGACYLYKYDIGQDRLIQPIKIVDDAVSDGIIYSGFDKNCLIATRKPTSTSNVLEFYESDNVMGKYTHKQTVYLDDSIARGAGELFNNNDTILRPAQISTHIYGIGLSFQKIDYTDGIYSVTEQFRKYPPKGYTGMHTFNSYGGYHVVDCRKFNNKFIAPYLFKVVQILKYK